MNWSPLARKEYAQAIRWRGLWLLAAVCLVLTYMGWGISGGIASPGAELRNTVGTKAVFAVFQLPFALVFGLASLLVAYRSLIGPPDDGSIKLVAALPHSRRDILVGTILSRAAAVWTAVFLVLATASIAGTALHGLFDPVAFVLVLGTAMVYVLVIVAIAVSVSVLSISRTMAATVVIAYYLVVNLLWRDVLSVALITALKGSYQLDPAPASIPLYLSKRIVPTGAFNVITNTAIGLPNAADSGPIAVLNAYGDPFGVWAVTDAFETVPRILSPEASLLVLLAWGSIPLLVAHDRFNAASLA